MSPRWCVALLMLLTGVGCSSARVVRLDTGREVLTLAPHEEEGAELAEARLEDDEFEDAMKSLSRDVVPSNNPMRQARELFGFPSRSGLYLYEHRTHRLSARGEPPGEGPHLLETYADEEMTQAYGRWCRNKGTPGDCLSLLEEGPLLGSDGKYVLAMAIAMGSVWDESAEALEDMTDPKQVLSVVMASVTMYMLLWSLPEPVSKGLATLLTVTAIAYLGVDTVLGIIGGWCALVRDVDRATTFEQLDEAGSAFGAVLGENAARVFVMLATAAIGNTAGLAAKSAQLPGSAQAALAVESQAGFQFAAMGAVRSVAVSGEGLTIALAPNALAMAGRENGASKPHRHHIATDKNSISTVRGGPWTPLFRKLFRRAGMELKDPENIVEVRGHRGPHPQRYHEAVYARLNDSVRSCRTVETCRKALTAELRSVAIEVRTKGTELHELVTKRK
ncbi:AHH domain-containing protein [Myxococcus sp. XM-1-1-1]|uniref:AHH domain-containing protein n=1 Tax=Myxococcus sp. XM-1-1-1 TaxID=2874602 RepID=UPI001CBCBD16|nr:AHH domain-containing protein [Myxococcus sp. XM-1-1-1]MBZ4411829.1 AHH domain-containing protein [Myxococcus sp. XM-1-1-1]